MPRASATLLSPSTSFIVTRVNKTTYSISEIDKFAESPLIYAKIHPAAPVIILSDTGCDLPADHVKNADFIHLRHLLEHYPVVENGNKPLNPEGERTYVIILTHCHYDHINGVPQFLAGGTTEIIASAAGRDFIESDLAAHSECKLKKLPVPEFKVTHWAQSFERLKWPLPKHLPGDIETDGSAIDLGIDIIHTPGHTPDELAWGDIEERTLYVGDSFYQVGEHAAMPIIWPTQGSLIDWNYSMQKLADYLVHSLGAEPESEDAEDDWTMITSTVKISAAHQTVNQPAVMLFSQLLDFWVDVVEGKRPVLFQDRQQDEIFSYWSSDVPSQGASYAMAIWCPQRLMDDLRSFYRVPRRVRQQWSTTIAALQAAGRPSVE